MWRRREKKTFVVFVVVFALNILKIESEKKNTDVIDSTRSLNERISRNNCCCYGFLSNSKNSCVDRPFIKIILWAN